MDTERFDKDVNEKLINTMLKKPMCAANHVQLINIVFGQECRWIL